MLFMELLGSDRLEGRAFTITYTASLSIRVSHLFVIIIEGLIYGNCVALCSVKKLGIISLSIASYDKAISNAKMAALFIVCLIDAL